MVDAGNPALCARLQAYLSLRHNRSTSSSLFVETADERHGGDAGGCSHGVGVNPDGG
jgi:hypothetical protein